MQIPFDSNEVDHNIPATRVEVAATTLLDPRSKNRSTMPLYHALLSLQTHLRLPLRVTKPTLSRSLVTGRQLKFLCRWTDARNRERRENKYSRRGRNKIRNSKKAFGGVRIINNILFNFKIRKIKIIKREKK